ncbi:dynein light chain roadblock-type 1 [Carettochelys insculpta]|uniref:dynein light chain roadblock-type 1 n=1 Tax=Carettochelys insculpta TaxID=44489 RepID=UPI003EBA8152
MPGSVLRMRCDGVVPLRSGCCFGRTLPRTMAEVEETLKRIQSQKGVQGIIVVNSEGIPIKSTLDNSTTVQYAGLMHSFIMKARSTVRDIDPQNDLTFLRIRSKKNEIMIAPDKDYFLIVIQNPTE